MGCRALYWSTCLSRKASAAGRVLGAARSQRRFANAGINTGSKHELRVAHEPRGLSKSRERELISRPPVQLLRDQQARQRRRRTNGNASRALRFPFRQARLRSARERGGWLARLGRCSPEVRMMISESGGGELGQCCQALPVGVSARKCGSGPTPGGSDGQTGSAPVASGTKTRCRPPSAYKSLRVSIDDSTAGSSGPCRRRVGARQ